VPFVIEVRLPDGEPPTGVTLKLAAAGGSAGSERIGDEGFELRAPGRLEIDLPPKTNWQVTSEVPGFWSPSELVYVEPAGGSLSLDLVPSAIVSGRLAVGRGERIPEEIQLEFRSVPGSKGGFSKTKQKCSIEAQSFECELPAGELDLKLRAPGFISHFFWGPALKPQEPQNLGFLNLRRGASLIGWVRPGAIEGFAYSDCDIEAAPVTAGDETPSVDRERRADLVSKAKVNSRGFFELTDLEPGAYRVVLRHPAYAPTTYSPIEVFPNAETEIYDIELRPASSISLRVKPATDPRGNSWLVELKKNSKPAGRLYDAGGGPVSKSGTWAIEGLEAVRYELVVKDRRGSSWAHETIDFETNGQEEFSLEIHLDAEEVHGVVLLGDEPIPARLYFGGYFSAERILTASDASGEFETVLPEQDEWLVDVEALELGVTATIEEVTVDRSASGPAEIQIIVPDTLIEGRVVDEAGEAYPGALVNVSPKGSEARTSHVESEAPDGGFSFRGLPVGPAYVQAEDGAANRRSHVAEIEISEDLQLAPLTLVVRDDKVLDGQVLSPNGLGVVGARVVGWVEQSSDLYLTSAVAEAVTDVDGVFEMKLPGAADRVQMTVFPPGFAVSHFRIDLRERSSVVLPVEPVGGDILLRFDEAPTNPLGLSIFSPHWLAHADAFRNWAEVHGVASADPTLFYIPRVRPGYYRICYGVPTFSGRLAPELESSHCVGGEVVPHGQLRLELPISEIEPAYETE